MGYAVKKALPSEVPYPAGLKGANNTKKEDDKSNKIENTKLEEAPAEAPKEETLAKEEAPKEASTKAEIPKEEALKEESSAKAEVPKEGTTAAEEAPTEASDQLKNDGKKEKEN